MKIVKKIAAVLLFAALVFSLTSCLALDDAKARHMVYNNESGSEIRFGDKVYKLLPNGNCLTENILLNDDRNYSIATEDVPVLLTYHYGHRVSYDKDLDIIADGNGLYCTEDKFDAYSKELLNPEFTSFAFASFENGQVDGGDIVYRGKMKKIDSDTAALIFEALSKEPESDDVFDEVRSVGYEVMCLYKATDNGFYEINPIRIVMCGGEYYILDYNVGSYALSDEAVEGLQKCSDGWDLYYNYENDFFNGGELFER